MKLRSLSVAIVLAASFLLTSYDADAIEPPIAVGEVSLSAAAPGSGIDPTVIRSAAEGEIRQLDASRLQGRRRVVVSFALTRGPTERPVVYNVHAMVRDARTGAMIAVIETEAYADAPVSAEVGKQVANAAVRSAVRRIPGALSR